MQARWTFFKFRLKLKESPFEYQGCLDPKILWHSRTLEEVQRFTMENGSFS